LNLTQVAERWAVPEDATDAEAQLRTLLARAKEKNLPVSIAGARHSMGGHTIAPAGIVIDMLPFHALALDKPRKILRAGSGARWIDIERYLDAESLSVGVMQSNNDFSVGGSISVNCHGWQPDAPPISSTVESFRLMKADGSIVQCSRNENAELFSLVLGGYGLFGIILDVELRVVPNECYAQETAIVAVTDYVAHYEDAMRNPAGVGMAYGRLCVAPGDAYFREAILSVFKRVPEETYPIPKLSTKGMPALRRAVYRAQVASDSGKALRWDLERYLGEQFGSGLCSRNQLQNEGAFVYADGTNTSTDILHEYFVPYGKLAEFLESARAIIPDYDVDLLNVTIRNVKQDSDSFLRYADQDMFAFVMLFSQPMNETAEVCMRDVTRKLIDAALACSGRYYLPYRLHATKEQFEQAYPQGGEFFAKKREFDPDERFQNRFYLEYGRS